MDWLEQSATTIDEALQAAAATLGVSIDDLEYEVIDEPVAGLFGRTRGQAKIRARRRGARSKKGKAALAKPVKAEAEGRSAGRPRASASTMAAIAGIGDEPAPERVSGRSGRAPRSSGSRSTSAPRPSRPRDEGPVDTDAVAASAKKFLDGLLNAAELTGKITHRVVDEQTVEMAVAGDDLGMLIGSKGATLLATQELLRTFVHHDTGGRSGRLMLDVGGYREKRRAALVSFTQQVAESVRESGERRVLEPMNAVDRKVVHDTVTGIAGVSSGSEGEEPYRYVVLQPE
jgi:spoIIIJ-associated protein